MSKSEGKRAERRRQIEAAILDAGREQLSRRGAAALSLREIARELGMVSSAIYRYVASRDELLTLLLVDAYRGLADAVDSALVKQRDAPPAEQLATLAVSMLEWADEHRPEWGLIYGAPVPGYAAPVGETTSPGTRVLVRLAELSPALASNSRRQPSTCFAKYLATGMRDLGLEIETAAAAWAVHAWCLLVGTISMVVFGQLGPEPQHDLKLARAILSDTVETLVDEARA